MMYLIAILSESFVFPMTMRAFFLVTVLLACSWIFSRIAGDNNAALRSHIWTTALILVLFVPLFSMLCERQHWVIVNLPNNWWISNDAIPQEIPTTNSTRIDNSAVFTPAEFKDVETENGRRIDSLNKSHLLSVAMSTEDLISRSVLKKFDQVPDANYRFKIVMSLLIALWGIGIAAGILRLVVTVFRLNSLFHSASAVNPIRIDCISSQACRTLRLDSLPRIVVSPVVTTAAAMYYGFKGIVILPSSMITELSDSELKDVVTHECAHLLRYDPLIGLLQSVAVILFWPHPLMYLARRELTRSREEVCDNYAMKGTDAIGYSKTLLRIAERGVMGTSLDGVASLSSNFWRLEDRIKGILNEDRSTRVSVGRCTHVCVVSLLGMVAVIGGFSRIGSAQQEKIARREIAAPESVHEAWHPQGVMVLGDERGRKWNYGNAFDLCPNGQQIATGSYDGRIFLWNAKTMILEHLLSGHDGDVVSVHYSPDGSRLFSIGADKRVLSWDLAPGGIPQSTTIGLLDGRPYPSVWSNDGNTLFVGQDVWRFFNETELRKVAKIPLMKGNNSELPDDVKTLAKSLKATSIMSGSGSGTANSLSSDGNQLAIPSGGNMIWINGETEVVPKFVDSTVTVWSIADGEPRQRFELDRVGFVFAIAFSSDGKTLAIGGHDNKTRLYNIANDSPQATHVIDHDEPVHGLCFDSKGETLVVAAGTVQLWDLKTNPPSVVRNAPLEWRVPLTSVNFAFSPDESRLFYCDGNLVRQWEVGRAYPEIDIGKSPSVLAPRMLAVRSKENQLLSVNQTMDESQILIRDFSALQSAPKVLIPKVDGQVGNLSFSNDEQKFAFSLHRNQEYTLQLWQHSPEGANLLDSADLKNGQSGLFWCTAFSPDGKTLATGHRDGGIRLWDVSNGLLQLIATKRNVHWGGVFGLDYSPNGKLLASVDYGGIVTLWDTTGDAIEMKVELGKQSEASRCVRFSPDGRTLATADRSGAIKLWTIGQDSSDVIELVSHTSGVTSLQFESTGKKLLSSGSDGRTIVWDLEKAKPVREWQFPGSVYDSKFDPTGQKIVTANGNGSIYVWDYSVSP